MMLQDTISASGVGFSRSRLRTVNAGEWEIDRAFYVQVRYPHGERWETVAVSAHRGVAASLAGGMYRDLRDDAGRSPVQVRIASDEKLRRDGGETAVRQAAADLWERAQATARGDP
jgi:hypothetical protein